MLSTRLWMGTILILMTVGMLVVDQRLAPWFPFLFVFVLGLSLLACKELLNLLGGQRPTQTALCYFGVLGLGLANWLPHLPQIQLRIAPLAVILGAFTLVVL